MTSEHKDTITHCKNEIFLDEFYSYKAYNYKFVFMPLTFKEIKVSGPEGGTKGTKYELVNPNEECDYEKLMMPRYNYLNVSLKEKTKFVNDLGEKEHNGINLKSFLDAAGYTEEEVYKLIKL